MKNKSRACFQAAAIFLEPKAGVFICKMLFNIGIWESKRGLERSWQHMAPIFPLK
jgi:hypothetical protein